MTPLTKTGRALSFAALVSACVPPAHRPATATVAPPPAVAASPAPAPPNSEPSPNSANGRDLPLRSSGTEQGDAWVLDENGYVGAFVQLDAPGPVRVTVAASGLPDGPTLPRMNIVVGALTWPYDVSREGGEHISSVDLGAGTHFIRVELVNDTPEANRQLTVKTLRVEGAKLVTRATDALALAAADTYIAHHRRGRARVVIPGATPGTKATIKLTRHAFNFGVNVPSWDNRYVLEPTEPGTDAARFQSLLAARFNTVVLSNAGKWAYHEDKRDKVTLAHVDRFFRYAEAQKFRARMHTMLWDDKQEPPWVGSRDPKKPGLIALALRGDAKAKTELDAEIDERIAYYVRDRAKHYTELDVINESVHRSGYLQVYGAPGIADIFNKTAKAAHEAGARTRLYLNEYNLLQWSTDPQTGAPDPYANWYRRHAEAIVRAGGAVDGLGVQYYPDGRDGTTIGAQTHSAARAFAVLQNLSTTGLRLSLTEFTVASQNASQERAAAILEETARLIFGSPQADTFMIWAIWAKAAGDPPLPASVLFDEQGELTAVGRRFDALLRSWTTELELPLDAEGAASFDGFYGEYSVTVGGVVKEFVFVPGRGRYSL